MLPVVKVRKPAKQVRTMTRKARKPKKMSSGLMAVLRPKISVRAGQSGGAAMKHIGGSMGGSGMQPKTRGGNRRF